MCDSFETINYIHIQSFGCKHFKRQFCACACMCIVWYKMSSHWLKFHFCMELNTIKNVLVYIGKMSSKSCLVQYMNTCYEILQVLYSGGGGENKRERDCECLNIFIYVYCIRLSLMCEWGFQRTNERASKLASTRMCMLHKGLYFCKHKCTLCHFCLYISWGKRYLAIIA